MTHSIALTPLAAAGSARRAKGSDVVFGLKFHFEQNATRAQRKRVERAHGGGRQKREGGKVGGGAKTLRECILPFPTPPSLSLSPPPPSRYVYERSMATRSFQAERRLCCARIQCSFGRLRNNIIVQSSKKLCSS